LFENKQEKKSEALDGSSVSAAQTQSFETLHRDENIHRLVHIQTTRKIFISIMENSNDNK